MTPAEVIADLESMYARPEPVCKVYVLFSHVCILGSVSKQAWLVRAEAERQRLTILEDMDLVTEDPDEYIRIHEVTIMRRRIRAQATEPVHPGVVACPGQVEIRPDQ